MFFFFWGPPLRQCIHFRMLSEKDAVALENSKSVAIVRMGEVLEGTNVAWPPKSGSEWSEVRPDVIDVVGVFTRQPGMHAEGKILREGIVTLDKWDTHRMNIEARKLDEKRILIKGVQPTDVRTFPDGTNYTALEVIQYYGAGWYEKWENAVVVDLQKIKCKKTSKRQLAHFTRQGEFHEKRQTAPPQTTGPRGANEPPLGITREDLEVSTLSTSTHLRPTSPTTSTLSFATAHSSATDLSLLSAVSSDSQRSRRARIPTPATKLPEVFQSEKCTLYHPLPLESKETKEVKEFVVTKEKEEKKEEKEEGEEETELAPSCPTKEQIEEELWRKRSEIPPPVSPECNLKKWKRAMQKRLAKEALNAEGRP